MWTHSLRQIRISSSLKKYLQILISVRYSRDQSMLSENIVGDNYAVKAAHFNCLDTETTQPDEEERVAAST